MKIINTSLFEKLKIRPVSVKELRDEGSDQIKKVSANTIKYSDLKVGYIVETKENRGNKHDNAFYMLVDIDTFIKLFDNNQYIYRENHKIMLVQPMPEFSEPDKLTYLRATGYEESWPCFDGKSKFDIENVYMLDCDLSDVETKGDFIKIYNKYMQYIKEL